MKISAGKFKGRLLKSPPGTGNKIRPSSSKVKDAFFNIIGGYLEKVIFLDLFSGTGSMGLEALSRGAEQAYFVENNRPSLEILRKNIELTGTQAQTRVLPLDAKWALQYLGKNRESFEIIYVDPPYNLPDIAGILDIIYREELLKNGGLIGVERSSRLSSRPGGFELGKTPFFLWKKKFYGNTLLLIFKNEQISAPNEINPKGGI